MFDLRFELGVEVGQGSKKELQQKEEPGQGGDEVHGSSDKSFMIRVAVESRCGWEFGFALTATEGARKFEVRER